MANYLIEKRICFYLYLVEIDKTCVDFCNHSILANGLEDRMSCHQLDGYRISSGWVERRNINIMYTTAEVEPILYLRLLCLCFKSSVGTLLVSESIVKSINSHVDLVKRYVTTLRNSVYCSKFANCKIDAGGLQTGQELR